MARAGECCASRADLDSSADCRSVLPPCVVTVLWRDSSAATDERVSAERQSPSNPSAPAFRLARPMTATPPDADLRPVTLADQVWWRWLVVLAVAFGSSRGGPPAEITTQSWRLLAIFIATIVGSIVRPAPRRRSGCFSGSAPSP